MNTCYLITTLLLSAASAVPALAGSFVIEATPFADATSASVALDVTITDNGELLPDCATFGIRRRAIYPCGDGWKDVACIARVNGTRTLHLVDTDVARNTTYEYQAIGYAPSLESCTVPFGDEFAFEGAFFYSGFPFPILEFVSVGPDPTPIAHGQLVSQDDPAANLGIFQCSDSCLQLVGAGGAGLANVAGYVDTGIDVLVYGDIFYNGNSAGYMFGATAAEPQECPPIAVEAKTWTHVKRLYR